MPAQRDMSQDFWLQLFSVLTTLAANFATLTAGVVETGGKFAAGVNDTGVKLPPVSTTLAVNLLPVTPTTVVNN